MKVGPQRASGVRIVCVRPTCCFEPRIANCEAVKMKPVKKQRKPDGGRKKSKPEYHATKNLMEQMERAVDLYPNGDEVSNIDIVYVCRKYSGTLKCQESEVEDIRFFEIDEMPELIFPPNQLAIEEYINEFKGRK